MKRKKNKNWDATEFTKAIRIKPTQLKWLMENKEKRTAAGLLDDIIERYKNGLPKITP